MNKILNIFKQFLIDSKFQLLEEEDRELLGAVKEINKITYRILDSYR